MDELISWCRVSVKPEKPRSWSVVKGKVAATTFSVAGKAIPMVMDELVRNLDRMYYASLIDKNAVQHIYRKAAS